MATVLLYLSDVEEGGETVFSAATDGQSPDSGAECWPLARRLPLCAHPPQTYHPARRLAWR